MLVVLLYAMLVMIRSATREFAPPASPLVVMVTAVFATSASTAMLVMVRYNFVDTFGVSAVKAAVSVIGKLLMSVPTMV